MTQASGAEWDGQASRIRLNDGAVTNLGLTALVWEQSSQKKDDETVPISVYLNEDRSLALFATPLKAESGRQAGYACATRRGSTCGMIPNAQINSLPLQRV